MSKKLSQAEIDALVASLLAGEAPAEEVAAPPEPEPVASQPIGLTNEAIALALAASEAPAAEPVAAEPAAAEPDAAQPAVAEPEPAGPDTGSAEALATAAAALELGDPKEGPLPFEQVVDLGLITDDEVSAALSSYRDSKNARRSAAAPAPATPVQAEPAAAAVMEAGLNAAETVFPAGAPELAGVDGSPSLPVMPPSAASYAASQAQAAAETRRVFAMAALSSVVMDIELTVAVELGKVHLSLGEVLALGPGSVITLDKLAATPVDVKVNQVPLMKADVLAIGEKYGIRVIRSSLKVPAAS